jgi:hypothetical protein
MTTEASSPLQRVRASGTAALVTDRPHRAAHAELHRALVRYALPPHRRTEERPLDVAMALLRWLESASVPLRHGCFQDEWCNPTIDSFCVCPTCGNVAVFRPAYIPRGSSQIYVLCSTFSVRGAIP